MPLAGANREHASFSLLCAKGARAASGLQRLARGAQSNTEEKIWTLETQIGTSADAVTRAHKNHIETAHRLAGLVGEI